MSDYYFPPLEELVARYSISGQAQSSRVAVYAEHPGSGGGRELERDEGLQRQGSHVYRFPLSDVEAASDSPLWVEFEFSGANGDQTPQPIPYPLAEPEVGVVHQVVEGNGVGPLGDTAAGETIQLAVAEWGALSFDQPDNPPTFMTAGQEEILPRIAQEARDEVTWRKDGEEQSARGEQLELEVPQDAAGSVLTFDAYRLAEHTVSGGGHASVQVAVLDPRITREGTNSDEDDEPIHMHVGERATLTASLGVEPTIAGTYTWTVEGSELVLLDAEGNEVQQVDGPQVAVKGAQVTEGNAQVTIRCRFVSQATGKVYVIERALTVGGVAIWLRLQYLDPAGEARPFPEKVAVRIEFPSGGGQDLEVDPEGLLHAENTSAEETCTLKFQAATQQWIARAIRGGTQPQEKVVAADQIDTAMDDGYHVFTLPRVDFALSSSDWQVQHPSWEQNAFRLGADPIGTEEEPVAMTLDPHWMLVRFEYHDRVLGEAMPMLAQVIDAHPDAESAGDGDAPIRSSWLTEAGNQAIPWIVQDPDHPKPDSDILLSFKNQEPTWIHTEQGGNRELVRDEPTMVGVERLGYYDLPRVWRSAGFFAQIKPNPPVELKNLAGEATSEDSPIVVSLDDLVLTDEEGNPLALPDDAWVALFANTFRQDEERSTGPGGLYKPDTENEREFASAVAITNGAIHDYPGWTRLVVYEGNLFDVFDRRVASDRADHHVGARAAVRYFDVADVGLAPGQELPAAMPDVVQRPSSGTPAFVHQPFFRLGYDRSERSQGRYEEWSQPYQYENVFKIGRFDQVLLRCCGVVEGRELAVNLQHLRLVFDFDPEPIATARPTWFTTEQAAEYRNTMCRIVNSRWNGNDNNGEQVDYQAEADDGLRVQAAWFVEAVGSASRAHFRIDVFASMRANMGSQMGIGQFNANATRSAMVFDHASGTWGIGDSTVVHEAGHGAGLPDEYTENFRHFSLGLPGFVCNTPGDPFSGQGGDPVMRGNRRIECRYFWPSAEWVRSHTGTELQVRQGEFRYQVPRQDDVERSLTHWPFLSLVREPEGVRGLADQFLYVLGEDSYAHDAAPSLASPIDGILVAFIRFRVRFRLTTTPLTFVALQGALQALRDRVSEALNRSFIAQATVGPQRFERLLLDFSPRFLVEDLPTDNARYLAALTNIVGQPLQLDLRTGEDQRTVATNAVEEVDRHRPHHFVLEIDEGLPNDGATWASQRHLRWPLGASAGRFVQFFAETFGLERRGSDDTVTPATLTQHVISKLDPNGTVSRIGG